VPTVACRTPGPPLSPPEIYPDGTVVTLTAVPGFGSYSAGWSGAGCSGTGTCTVTMTASQRVTPTFNLPAPNEGFPQCVR
jgi:hypothetical protein